MASIMIKLKPLQGEIWLFDPEPTKGTEIGKKIRPCIVISHDIMNSGPSELILVVPLTSVHKGIPSHVQIDPSNNGVSTTNFALCEQIISISKIRLIKKLGKVTDPTILEDIRSWIIDLITIE